MTTTRYRKRPVEIDAIQWTGSNIAEIWDVFGAGEIYGPTPGRDYLEIHTLEGRMRASIGDWIIRGVKGELYPCRDDIFAATYAPAESSRHGSHTDTTRTTSPTDEDQPHPSHAGSADRRTAAPCDALCRDVEADRDRLLGEAARLEQQVIDMGGHQHAAETAEAAVRDAYTLANTWDEHGQGFAADDLRAVLDKARTTTAEETP